MLSHYITIALRFMSRNSGLTAINIIGFTIGLVAGLLIYIWVDDELRFDAFHPHADHIYRVVQIEKSGEKSVYHSPKLGEDMQKMFPQIVDHTLIDQWDDYAYILRWGSQINAWSALVDKNFFTFFNFPFVEGNPETAFIDDQSIVISEKYARKLFGKTPALGQEVTFMLPHDIFSMNQRHFRIGGVVRLPHNTHFSFDVALQIGIQGEMFSSAVYLRFNERTAFDSQLQETLSRHHADHKRSGSLLWFQPLRDIHLKNDVAESNYIDHHLGNMQYVIVFTFLAVIIVLMGAFNFMTLSTAQAVNRIKEVAVRKAYGGSKNDLMGQFFSETLIQVLIAMVFALALVHVFLPYLNNFTNKEMTLYFGMHFWITVAAALLVVGCVAGSYPALYLSSFSPVLIFKGGKITGGKTGFIRILMVVQFVFSIGLIICTLVVFRQLSYISNKNLGIDKENIITARCGIWYGADDFKQEVMRNPNVISVGMSLLTPESFSFEMQNVTWEGKTTQDSVRMNMAIIDGDFAKTYGLQVVYGELLRTSGEDYFSGKGGGAMINETAARVMGVANPVGMTINGNKIVAVVRDFHFRSLKEPIVPLVMVYNAEALVNISFKLTPVNRQATIAFIKETYERMRNGTGFEYRFFDDLIAESYQTENRLGRLFMIFAFLSLVISCLGILGLTAISTQKRTKEIGLRKIAGASVLSIMILLNRNYMLWIAIAFVIAAPIAALLMNRWLQGFAYHAGLSWWIFALAGLITLTVAVATISWLCYRAASRNPVESLKYE